MMITVINKIPPDMIYLLWAYSLLLKSKRFGIQPNGKRAVIDKGNLHHGAEFAVFHFGHRFPAFGDDIFIQFLGQIRFAGINKGRPVPVLTICIQCKL